MPKQAQHFPKSAELKSEKGIELRINQCENCGLIQLNNEPVDYYKEVVRASGFSAEMQEYRKQQFKKFIKDYQLVGKKVVEIGCGKGEYLSILNTLEIDAWGIEYSTESVKICREIGLNIIEGFVQGPEYKIKQAPYDAFFIMSYLEHIPEINFFLKGIKNNLKIDGIGLIEVPNFDMIVEENLFAEFIPDHLYYFTESTLKRTLELNGFEIIDCKPVWYDYILSATVRNRQTTNLKFFEEAQKSMSRSINAFVQKFEPNKVAVWGAGHQALALLSLAKLDGKIRYVVDSAPFKQNRYTPASHIPIFAPSKLKEDPVDAVIVMGASYSDEIVRLLQSDYPEVKQIAKIETSNLSEIPNQ